MFRNMLNGFGPEVYFPMASGMTDFTTNIAVCIIIMLSFDTPASMSFKVDTLSVAANPIFNTRSYLLKSIGMNFTICHIIKTNSITRRRKKEAIRLNSIVAKTFFLDGGCTQSDKRTLKAKKKKR